MIKYKKQNFWNKREGYILITSREDFLMKHIKTTKPIEKDYWNWVHQKLSHWIKKKCEQGEKRIRHWEYKSHWFPLLSLHTYSLHASKMDCSCSFLCKTKLCTCALNSIPFSTQKYCSNNSDLFYLYIFTFVLYQLILIGLHVGCISPLLSMRENRKFLLNPLFLPAIYAVLLPFVAIILE